MSESPPTVPPTQEGGATFDQLAQIAEIAADPIGPPEQSGIREKYLDRQRALADTRSRAESNEQLLKHRVV